MIFICDIHYQWYSNFDQKSQYTAITQLVCSQILLTHPVTSCQFSYNTQTHVSHCTHDAHESCVTVGGRVKVVLSEPIDGDYFLVRPHLVRVLGEAIHQCTTCCHLTCILPLTQTWHCPPERANVVVRVCLSVCLIIGLIHICTPMEIESYWGWKRTIMDN